MNVIVTGTAPDLDAVVDPRFGRGAYLIAVDSQTLAWEAYANEAVHAAGGAGTQAAQHVAQKGAQAVISGDFGPNAYLALAAAEIKMYLLGPSKTVREALANFNAGTLEQVHAATGSGHHGAR